MDSGHDREVGDLNKWESDLGVRGWRSDHESYEIWTREEGHLHLMQQFAGHVKTVRPEREKLG